MKKKSIDPALIELYKSLSKSIVDDKDASIKDKLAVLDRGIKIEFLKARLKEEEFGNDFETEGEDDE